MMMTSSVASSIAGITEVVIEVDLEGLEDLVEEASVRCSITTLSSATTAASLRLLSHRPAS